MTAITAYTAALACATPPRTSKPDGHRHTPIPTTHSASASHEAQGVSE